ncbi:dynamin family protein, partial [Staphylococcus aureus]|nr:dynamin family protein [Staphylococcus aureus]
EEIAPLKQKLEQLHIFIEPEFNKSNIELDDPYLKIDLSQMLSALPKSLTKKNILKPKMQNEVQTTITQNTLVQLKPCIAELRKALIEIVNNLNNDAEIKFNQYEKDIHTQIKQLLAFEMDHSLIKQLQETNSELKAQLLI